MHKRFCLVVLACAVFAASGCDTVKPYWKSTKSFYKTYINVDPTVDLKDEGTSDPSVRKLAELFTPVDARLEHLLRTLSTRDVPPDEAWARAFLEVYPWVSGMAVLDESGRVVQGLRVSPKVVSFEPLLEFEKRYKAHQMSAAVATSELGNEILIGKPLWVDGEYKGLLIAYFDPAALAKFSSDPSQLVMFMPGVAFNTGGNLDTAQALAAHKDWKKILKSNISGEISIGGTKYLWQARYVAQLNLVYAVAVVPKGAKSEPVKAAAPVPQEVVQPTTPGESPEAGQPVSPTQTQ